MEFPQEIFQRLETARVVAGFSVNAVKHAVPLCRALLAGGIDAIELTLRTPVGLDALKVICAEIPEMLVGAGTLLTPDAAVRVKEAGADFGVSPGMNPRVVDAAQAAGLPFAPGICTPSELESAIERGCRFVKFFPAEPAGGVHYLRSLAAPYGHLGIRYFPLGGLNAENMMDYLREDHVPAIGGSWIVQKALVEAEDWAGISARAAAVRALLDRASE